MTDQEPKAKAKRPSPDFQEPGYKLSRTGMPNLGQPYLTNVFARYPELRKLFLKHYARFGNQTAAAAHVRLSLEMIEVWRKRDPEFQAQVERAKEEHKASIERAIHQRAIDGWTEPRFSKEGVIGHIRRYSDSLLLAYARRHIPEYREGDTVPIRGELNHKHQHQIDVSQLSREQRAALRLLIGGREEETQPTSGPDEAEAIYHRLNGSSRNGNGSASHGSE